MDPKLMKESVHFFKIILAHCLLEGKLRIPTEFVKKYGEGLSKSVILKLPNNEEWKVKLAEHDGEVWFDKGWKEFANHYSLAHGHLLVFRYEAPSCFQVLIFNRSALEVIYPIQSVEDEEENNDQGLKVQVREIEIPGDCQPCRKSEMHALVAFHKPCKIRMINEHDEHDNSTNLQMVASCCKSRERKGELKLRTQAGKGTIEQNNKSLSISFSGVDEANSKFTSECPFFRISIQLKHLQRRYMHFPKDFANQYIKHVGPAIRIVTLMVGVRKWRVHLINNPKKCLLLLSAGWAAFLRENGLEVGDVCFFHLLNSDDIVMNVSILKHRLQVPEIEIPEECQPCWKRKQNSTVAFHQPCKIGRITEGDEDDNSTKFLLEASHSKSIESKGLQVREIEILEECQPCWKRKENSLVAFHQPCKIARISEGDEDDNSNNLQMEASHSKNIESKGELKLQTQAEKGPIEQNNKSSSTGLFGALEANRKFTSECPFFQISIQLRNIQKRYMHLPRGFTDEYIKPVKSGRQIVTLKVGSRTWRVKLICDPKRPIALFSAGWAAFSRENGLGVGDVCFFLLLNSDHDIVMKVSILRRTNFALTS